MFVVTEEGAEDKDLEKLGKSKKGKRSAETIVY